MGKKNNVYMENIPLNDVDQKLQEVYGITVLCNRYCDSLRFTGIFPVDDLDLAIQLVFEPLIWKCKNVGGEWRLYKNDMKIGREKTVRAWINVEIDNTVRGFFHILRPATFSK